MSIIQVSQNNCISNISYAENDHLSLLEILSEHGFQLNSPCGGNGYCNKCIVTVNGKQTKSCTYIPNGDICVTLPSSPDSDNTFSIADISSKNNTDSDPIIHTADSTTYSVAIDLGSTSVSIAVVSTKIIDECTIKNPSSIYGSDIISRAQSCVNGKKEIVAKLLVTSLENEITRLMKKNNLDISNLNSIYIAANTAMQLMLLSLDCSEILTYPFKINEYTHSFIYKNHPVYIIPSFSAFVGGDIVSGLYYLSPVQYKNYLFIDIGTNAEIVLSTHNKLYCTSAAAGPAFEGANISCGTAYVSGAINNASIIPTPNSDYKITYKTIDNKLPCGICGTGILDIYSQMIKHGIIDKFKTLSEKYIDNGFKIAHSVNGNIIITQNDIRQIQLALSAIHTAIEILLSKAELSANEIEKIYISGSFGSALTPETLASINIFPFKILNSDLISFSGNTSLLGAIKAATHKQSPEQFKNIINSCTEITLANEPDFNDLFLKNM